MDGMLTQAQWNTGCRHLAGVDTVLAELIVSYGDERLEPHGDVFATLARAIIGQQISVLAAERIWLRVLDLLGTVSPQAVVEAGEGALARCGLTRRKAASLATIAQGIAQGEQAMPGSREQLLALPGVGPWTADMVAIFALGAADILPVGDIGLQRAIVARYGIVRQALDRGGLERLAEPWRPWRSIAVWYLWRDLDPVPVTY